jgi:CheY-like chemotaxis protein
MKKILFVDDNQHLHDLMKKLLGFMGYESISAASAKEGLEKAVSEKPDVILLDIGLPDMDGRDAARRLRADPATKNIPILGFTASLDTSLGKSYLEAGCDDYAVKPVTYEVLREKLQALLDI